MEAYAGCILPKTEMRGRGLQAADHGAVFENGINF